MQVLTRRSMSDVHVNDSDHKKSNSHDSGGWALSLYDITINPSLTE